MMGKTVIAPPGVHRSRRAEGTPGRVASGSMRPSQVGRDKVRSDQARCCGWSACTGSCRGPPPVLKHVRRPRGLRLCLGEPPQGMGVAAQPPSCHAGHEGGWAKNPLMRLPVTRPCPARSREWATALKKPNDDDDHRNNEEDMDEASQRVGGDHPNSHSTSRMTKMVHSIGVSLCRSWAACGGGSAAP